ncbi:dihydroxyacetone kinase [Ameyamaea chiangmaiensis NBRC 103196]|uniref:Dihydroxyacetone kinase family protein n=1 Tax=Ameyamaea chiangmaiensis TaxID=442969 RepID=A0A850PCZ2_9PROT|nr:dihydroxyacetone kinase family protein [Ameyamaea chiangmaiensis]MBS4076047.1 dihydroxyacetone kinase family protein [Ameyamaea chiangmaiensis]NVN39822.1 dihydroxyacetone kinase family protein [Ameyamaea chiangmaiensis]GBQ66816.1 dihydroxyacetone kinase [Ameyamaea chiangmaiensis NBRC 103196]
MTHIIQNPEEFAETALAGYCDVYSRIVRPVPGGVVRSTHSEKGKVAFVVGGGSGHFPTFSGFVGRGFADAAVAGDIFASPSTRLVYEVCKMADLGGGIIMSFGNYAGDVLNFGFAAERLRAEGIDARIVHVTDDVASAPKDQISRRRGVAGDIPVCKITGAAADRGDSLDEVERLSRLANASTRSFGVAFGGCTLPGAIEPLFEVKTGMMALGLGIHGEPGIEEVPLAPASDLGKLLVERVLADRPDGSSARVAVLLNGLGTTKYEELFVLWTYIKPLLEAAGLTLVSPIVGEYVTSLNMEGCSLTVTWLDEELEPLWLAPCDAAALRVGNLPDATPAAPLPDAIVVDETVPESSEESRKVGELIARGVKALSDALAGAEGELGRIDAQAGDGDHGHGMARGAAAAAAAAAKAASAGAGAATVLGRASDAWADRAGGTSGAIWGLGLRSAALGLSDTAAPSAETVTAAVLASLENVMALGGAKVGDKTLIDAFEPFAKTLSKRVEAGDSLATAWEKAAKAADEAATATAQLLPKLGRARPLAERSKGHRDAGAVSFALVAHVTSKVE